MLHTVVHTETNKNKSKPKQLILGVFNRIKSALSPKQQMVTTDVTTIDQNDQARLVHSTQMVQNSMNQLNQNTTVIGTQQIRVINSQIL